MPIDPIITTLEVREISGASTADLSPFIRVANTLINEHLDDQELSQALLREIGLYLAAHFAFLYEGQVKSEKIGASSTTFNMATDLALLSTTFGQTAIFLDPSGKLAGLQKAATSKPTSTSGGASSLDVI